MTATLETGYEKRRPSPMSSVRSTSTTFDGLVGGEQGRREEGRPLFEFGGWRDDGSNEIKNTEGGSRATIAIVMLVKNPNHYGPATIHYSQVDDYLSAGQKIRAQRSPW